MNTSPSTIAILSPPRPTARFTNVMPRLLNVLMRQRSGLPFPPGLNTTTRSATSSVGTMLGDGM